jgi:hypothetical protein
VYHCIPDSLSSKSWPITDAISSSAHKEWAEIASLAEVIEPKARSREEFIEECKSGAFEDVSIAFRTFMSVAITGIVDEELISHLPKSLKFIAHNGRKPIEFDPFRFRGSPEAPERCNC